MSIPSKGWDKEFSQHIRVLLVGFNCSGKGTDMLLRFSRSIILGLGSCGKLIGKLLSWSLGVKGVLKYSSISSPRESGIFMNLRWGHVRQGRIHIAS